MTRYIVSFAEAPNGPVLAGRHDVDPTDLPTVQALWSALPPDLRLALAKTAPKVAKWRGHHCYDQFGSLIVEMHWTYGNAPGEHLVLLNGTTAYGKYPRFDAARVAGSAALLAQGYVLDGETP